MQNTVAEQLAERVAQKQMEATLRLQEEQGISNAMAAELKAKMEVMSLRARPEMCSADFNS